MNDYTLKVSFTEICQALDSSEQTVVELVKHDIVKTQGEEDGKWVFDVAMVSVAKRAVRLRRDLDLDWSAIAMVLELVEQRDQLKAENESLKRMLQRFL